MRTQLIGTRRTAADNRKGGKASILQDGEDMTEFLSRMGGIAVPIGHRGPENRTGANRYSAFLSTPTWIRTGMFVLTEPRRGVAPTPIAKVFECPWITTGVFGLATLWGRAAEPSGTRLWLAA